MKTAIVLSGGGSKGAYEIGVWKALQRLHITYDIVTGTSVGALNGAFMVQQKLKPAEWMWDHINFNMVFSNFEANYNTIDGKAKILKHYTEGILFHGGADVSALEETIKKYIDLDLFYKSSLDYGLVTVDFTDLKPLELQKKDIPRHLLCDYLMASATCYPAFQKKKIGKHQFIDGGYYDNVPINLAIKLGAKKIIVVNIGKSGEMKTVIDPNVEITLIEPHNDLGSFLVFDQQLSKRVKTLGYNDTMKVFRRYDGNLFTFKSRQLKKFVKKYDTLLKKKLTTWIEKDTLLKSGIKNHYYREFLEMTSDDLKQKFMLEMIEDLGIKFHLEETIVYTESSFNKKLISFCLKEVVDKDSLDRGIFLDQLKKISHSKKLVLYLYNKLLEVKNDGENQTLVSLAYLFQKDFLEALYLTLLK